MNIKKMMLLGLVTLLGLTFISCDKSTTTITENNTTLENNTTTANVSGSNDDILEAAANKIIISNSDNLTSNFTLPAEVDGLTVTWASNNTEYISVASEVTATDGYLQYLITVNQPDQTIGTVTVTITGTFYYEDDTYTKDFTVRVPAVEDATVVTTIAAGLALETGTYITWKDMTVIGFSNDPTFGPSGFFFTDGVDVMYVFNSTFLETMTIGGVYDIKGCTYLHYSIPEIKTIDANTVDVQPSAAAAKTLTPTVASISQIIANHTGYSDTNPMDVTMYTITGTVYKDTSAEDKYSVYIIPAGTLSLDKDNAIRVYYKSNMDVVENFVGQTVTLDLLMFGYNASVGSWYANFLGEASDISVANMTDADKLAMSEAQVESSYDITTSFELPALVYGDYSNIQISSEISSYLSYSEGVFTVTRPAEDTTGTMSLTITYNDETANLTINIIMKAEVVFTPGDDIYISQYIEGGSYNKYIEIFNPTDASVDLSEYTLELYSNGNTEANATMTLSGLLAPGEVIVIYNDKSDPILYTGDIVDNSVINFNGDDAIVLKHNGTVVDSIGQVGVDPGDYWGDETTVSTKDMTLIRKSSITGGDTNPYDVYDPTTQWDAYAKDSAEGLGSHTQD